jgi:dTDP-4-dehydrorhamnose reductase
MQAGTEHLRKPVAWVTGAGGLIGNYLVATAPLCAPRWQVRGLTRAALDLTDAAAVCRAFAQENPSLVIHCAALSKSPACQADPGLARRLNIDVTRQLAGLSAEIPFLFFSTDLVFDGRKGDYIESDPVNPLSVYGETKLVAERVVLANPRHCVVRTSLNGGVSPTGDRGFNEDLRRSWEQGRSSRLFVDEFRTPIFAGITARAVWELIESGRPGLYHLAGSERLSRWEIGQRLAERWPRLNPKLEPATVTDYRGAPRPPDTSLNCAKLQSLLSFKLPGLTEWLRANPQEIF